MRKSKLLLIALMLSGVLSSQNSNIYNSIFVTSDDEVLFQSIVKSISNDKYNFESFKIEENQFIGIANGKSKTSNNLFDKILTENSNSNYMNMLLTDDSVNEFQFYNNRNSNGLAWYWKVLIYSAVAVGVVLLISSIEIELPFY